MRDVPPVGRGSARGVPRLCHWWPLTIGGTMSDPRLFRLAYEQITCSATYVAGEGWRLHVFARRQGELADESYQETYSYLSSSELADLICSDVSDRLQGS